MGYLRWAWQYVKEARWKFFLGTLLVNIEMIANLLIVVIQKQIVDDIFIGGNYGKIPFIASLLLIAVSVSVCLYTLAPMILHTAGMHIKIKLSQQLLKNIYKLKLSSYLKNSTGRYVNYFSDDVNIIGDYLSYKIPAGLQQLISVILISLIILYINPILLLVLLFLAVSYICAGKYFGNRLKQKNFMTKEKKTEVVAVIENGLSATREILAYNRTQWFKDIFHQRYKKYFESVLKEAREQNKNIFVVDPITWIAQIFVLIFGAYSVYYHRMTVGEYVIAFQFTSRLNDSVQSLYDTIINFSGLFSSIDRINSITDSFSDRKKHYN
ncbi:ABC transporter ATP-binding protein, partial [Paenibacillus sp. P3E]|uniref:ABC transporter transmembrane domain-containing protein n=1 Tax=Paenibacillus sp. P3E TaxID=1349435 RepID=UPI000A7A94A3